MCTCNFYRYEDMNTYILTERRNFKTFWKENYAVGLDSCYVFNLEHRTEHDIDSAYGVCMHYTLPNFTADEFDSLLACNIISFYLTVYGRQIFYLALVAPARILESIEIKWGLALNERGYCENTLGNG